MRFDDSLDTVLSAEVAGPHALQMMWRQAVDLIGRRRGGRREGAIARLHQIRDDVPLAVRAASARGLERANPPADLSALFLVDDPAVAAPVARSARLTVNEWLALLPEMHPATRGVLRHRRDLPDRVVRALESFGPSDYALPSAVSAEGFGQASEESPVIEDASAALVLDRPHDTSWPPVDAPLWPPVSAPEPPDPYLDSADAAVEPEDEIAPRPPVDPEPAPPPFVAPEPLPFVAVADIARELPVVAEAMRREAGAPPPPVDEDFQIAELVARIEAHHRGGTPRHDAHPAATVEAPTQFRFETDADGVIRWCEGIERGPVIGLSLAAGRDGAPATDAGASGALARRARFGDARLTVPGASPAAGGWRISGTPVFDHASGRFTGYRGTARRPRADEEPRAAGPTPATDVLRQLVHELRTPANAISGFAEMIAHEMLGPVPPAYREQAAAIRDQTAGLLGAIDDLDTAARLESRSLELREDAVPLATLLGGLIGELRPLGELRGSRLAFDVGPGSVVAGDARAVERLFSRLFAALLSNAAPGETIEGSIGRDGDTVRCDLTRPAALAVADRALFSPDAEVETREGGPLLGAGFAFRLAQRLATELGGALAIGPQRLTLSLPAAVAREVEQATV